MKKTTGFLAAAIFLAAFGFKSKPISGIVPVCADLDLSSNIYLVTEKQVLIKFNSKGDSMKAVSCAQYGTDAMIDASNPLEIMVFFPLTGKVAVYDNQLNVISETGIFEDNMSLLPAAFGRSSDGKVWLLDKSSRTIKKFDKQGKMVQESLQLMEYNFSDTIQRIRDQGTKVLLSDGKNTFWEFGQSLSLIRKLKKEHTTLLGFTGNTVTYTNNKNQLIRFETGEEEKERTIETPKTQIIYAANAKQVLKGNNENGLWIE